MKKLIYLLMAVLVLLTAVSCKKDNKTQEKLPLVTSAPGWLELPEVFKVDGFEFFCHDGTLNGKKIRNWSFYWDYDNRVSKWVASGWIWRAKSVHGQASQIPVMSSPAASPRTPNTMYATGPAKK